jgi:superfamily II DNA or RNA helicase
MTEYRQIKGYSYEEYVLNSLINDYDSVYYFKNTPENIIAKTKLYSNYEIYQKYKNCDIGVDLVAIKNDQVYFIQCKNFDSIISINDFCSFYFLILEFELNGIVYYNGILSERLTDLIQGKIKYYNLPYNNTIIDVNFIGDNYNKIIPRDYQLEIYDKFKNINRGIIALPCGMGKTYCSWLIGKDYDNIIIVSPTRSLADTNIIQLYNYSSNTYNPILISMDGNRKCNDIKTILREKNIISSTYNSVDILNKIIKKLDNSIIFIDEYHNLSMNDLENKSSQLNNLITKNKKIIFMSATPLLNNNYVNIFGDYIYKYDWNKAIEKKYICDYKIIIPNNTKDTQIFSDLLKNINYMESNKEQIIKIFFILRGMEYYGNNKLILYSTDTNEAKEYLIIIEWIKKMLNINIGINIIDYRTSKLNRIESIKNFKTSNINEILINVQIFNEGIDIPECDSVFITKPNDNVINLIQRMCRCNRILPNKKICNIYIWTNDIKKIKKNINDFIDNKINYFDPNQIKKIKN